MPNHNRFLIGYRTQITQIHRFIVWCAAIKRSGSTKKLCVRRWNPWVKSDINLRKRPENYVVRFEIRASSSSRDFYFERKKFRRHLIIKNLSARFVWRTPATMQIIWIIRWVFTFLSPTSRMVFYFGTHWILKRNYVKFLTVLNKTIG